MNNWSTIFEYLIIWIFINEAFSTLWSIIWCSPKHSESWIRDSNNGFWNNKYLNIQWFQLSILGYSTKTKTDEYIPIHHLSLSWHLECICFNICFRIRHTLPFSDVKIDIKVSKYILREILYDSLFIFNILRPFFA